MNLLERTERYNINYTNPDNDPRGEWMRGDLSEKTYSKDYDYEITLPSGRRVSPPRGRCWMTSYEKFKEVSLFQPSVGGLMGKQPRVRSNSIMWRSI